MAKIIHPFKLEGFLSGAKVIPTGDGYTLSMRSGDELIGWVQTSKHIKKGKSKKNKNDTHVLDISLPFYSTMFMADLIPSILDKFTLESGFVPDNININYLDDKKIKDYDQRIISINDTLETIFKDSHKEELLSQILSDLNHSVYNFSLNDLDIKPSASVLESQFNLEALRLKTQHEISFKLDEIPFYGSKNLFVDLVYLDDEQKYIDRTGDLQTQPINILSTYIELTSISKDNSIRSIFNLIPSSDYKIMESFESEIHDTQDEFGIANSSIIGFKRQNGAGTAYDTFYENPHLEDTLPSEGEEMGIILKVDSHAKRIGHASATLRGIIEFIDPAKLNYKFIEPLDTSAFNYEN